MHLDQLTQHAFVRVPYMCDNKQAKGVGLRSRGWTYTDISISLTMLCLIVLFLDWGISCARHIHVLTADMQNGQDNIARSAMPTYQNY